MSKNSTLDGDTEDTASPKRLETPSLQQHNFSLPPWFKETCIMTVEELQDRERGLSVRETEDTNLTEDLQRDQLRKKSSTQFEIEAVIYKALRVVISEPQASVPKIRPLFKNDVLYIRIPNPQTALGYRPFLQTIAENFAKDLGASLVTLSVDDIMDLAQYDARQRSAAKVNATFAEYMDPYFALQDEEDYGLDEDEVHDSEDEAERAIPPENPGMNGNGEENTLPSDRDNEDTKMDQSSESTVPDHTSFFSTILRAAQQGSNSESTVSSSSTPLIIHLPDIEQLVHTHSAHSLLRFEKRLRPCLCPRCKEMQSIPRGRIILERLTEAIRTQSPKGNNTLLLMSSHRLDPSQDKVVVSAAGINQYPTAVQVMPVISDSQMTLLKDESHRIDFYSKKNIRLLARSMREHYSTAWDDCDDLSLLSRARGKAMKECKEFSQAVLPDGDLGEIVALIGDKYNSDYVAVVIQEYFARQKVFEGWRKFTSGDHKWSKFTPEVQSAVRKIADNKDPHMFIWERRFLDLLICPGSVKEGWDQIKIDSDIKDTLTHIIDHHSGSRKSAYGLLKEGRTGGALLYGPPGTGKTHLARIVAHEFKSVVIAVTPADLTNSYVGESEKAIQGLFSLARMLSPSIIFIDEADSLFHQRTAGDRTWERNQTNQLLTEMDGLVRHDNAPFVLLASNFPRQLDHAVLRRAPARIYIPLPSDSVRRDILTMLLGKEKLDSNVDYDQLVHETQGYSGSDIRQMCILAAMLAEASKDQGDDSPRRITITHLQTALKRVTRTVSKTIMSPMKAFAKEFDRPGLEKMERVEILS